MNTMSNELRSKRILLISDSLGTPIHARGIFNFTCSAMQILKRIGFEVYLLIEKPVQVYQGMRGSPARQESFSRAILCDVIRHFEKEHFSFAWKYDDPSFQHLADSNPQLANFCLGIDDKARVRDQWTVDLCSGEFDDLATNPRSEHLRLFSGFVLADFVYSESMRRGFQGLRPVSVDTSAFDFVYIDTPHYVMPCGTTPENVMHVIHDFIPLYDTSMSWDWRQLFVNKLTCTLNAGINVICNSETTRNSYIKIYGEKSRASTAVVYCPNRTEVAEAAPHAARPGRSPYIQGISIDKVLERQSWISNIKNRHKGNLELQEQKINRSEWRPDLPFFCTVLSDEPRKNVSVIVEVSKRFVGRANFIVIGLIDGNRYMDQKPEDFPNLHFTGYLTDGQKFDLLGTCTGFVFPSKMEGFGIPIIEAASFGARVICSDIEVFREITFDQALYFDPSDVDALHDRIERVLQDENSFESARQLQSLALSKYSQSAMLDSMEQLFKDNH